MSELEVQLRESVYIVQQLKLSTRALEEVTAALRTALAENELLRAELQIANLKLERLEKRQHLRAVPTPRPAA